MLINIFIPSPGVKRSRLSGRFYKEKKKNMEREPLNKFHKWLYRDNEKVEFGIQEEMDAIEMVINKFETIFEKEL